MVVLPGAGAAQCGNAQCGIGTGCGHVVSRDPPHEQPSRERTLVVGPTSVRDRSKIVTVSYSEQ